MKINKKKKGFTLIELIVVIAILGILAAVAIPRFAGIKDKSQVAANKATATTIVNAAETAYQNGETDTDCKTISTLISKGYLRGPAPTGTYTMGGSNGTYTCTYPDAAGTGIGGTVGQ